jgi:pimeloyl-ACP methyl ester carboxylesterase
MATDNLDMLPEVKETFIPTPQGKLFARAWGRLGENIPVILFHDSLGSVELWRDFPSRLAKATGHPVIAYDRLGFGKSASHPGHLQPDFINNEAKAGVHALRKYFALDKMILFGHSIGGPMAVAAGVEFPDSTSAIITEAAQTCVEEKTISGIKDARLLYQHPKQIKRLSRYHGEKAQWVLDAWTETWLSPKFRNWNLDNELRRLQCPVLAIHGENDEYGSVENPKRIIQLAPKGGDCLILDKCGHIPHREMPYTVLEAVDKFLKNLSL